MKVYTVGTTVASFKHGWSHKQRVKKQPQRAYTRTGCKDFIFSTISLIHRIQKKFSTMIHPRWGQQLQMPHQIKKHSMHIISSHLISYHIISSHIISHHIISRHIISNRIRAHQIRSSRLIIIKSNLNLNLFNRK